MIFEQALTVLKNGGRVSRGGWNGKDMYIELVKGNRYQVNGLDRPVDIHEESGNIQHLSPWVGINDCKGYFGPWAPSQADLLAEDWIVFYKIND